MDIFTQETSFGHGDGYKSLVTGKGTINKMTLKHFDKPPIEIRKLARALRGLEPSLPDHDPIRCSHGAELAVFESDSYAYFSDDDCISQLLSELGKAFAPVEVLLRISPPPKEYKTPEIRILVQHPSYHVVASVKNDLGVLGMLYSVVANHETWSFVGFDTVSADNPRRLAEEVDTEALANQGLGSCFVLTIDLDGIMRGIAPTGSQFDVFFSRIRTLGWVE